MARDARNVGSWLDERVLAYLPEGDVVEVVELGLSDWCQTHRIDVKLQNCDTQRFFTKTASGCGGFEQMQAHWHSKSSLYRFIPEFIPRPIAFDRYESTPETHFFLMEFVEMLDDAVGGVPEPVAYMAPLPALHLRSIGQSPTGKFGFSVSTRFGNLSQPNDWEDSWEVWWTKHMRMIVAQEEAIRGPHSTGNAAITRAFLDLVLPRYLRPLETNGRSVKPCLCHTDLWPGNVKYKPDRDAVVVYDANALWAHSEVELATFRNPRYPLGKTFIDEYHKHVPVSEPKEDADSRIMMYMIRHQVCLASLYPEEAGLRDLFLSNMASLVGQVKKEMTRQML